MRPEDILKMYILKNEGKNGLSMSALTLKDEVKVLYFYFSKLITFREAQHVFLKTSWLIYMTLLKITWRGKKLLEKTAQILFCIGILKHSFSAEVSAMYTHRLL